MTGLTSAYAEDVSSVGPGHIRVHTVKRMWPYAAQITSECGVSNWISVCSQYVLGAFTSVLRLSTDDQMIQDAC